MSVKHRNIGIFSTNVIHEMVSCGVSSIMVQGMPVKLSGRRLRLFATKGTQCKGCARMGRYYMAERNQGNAGFSLNLYAACGTLMTQDHIFPLSRGGTNAMENLQPMCSTCNGRKGDTLPCEFSS